MEAEMNIRTTITADSVQRIFGAPTSVDYRSHPGEEEAIDSTTIFESMKEKEVPPLEDIKKFKGTVYSYKNRRIITCWLRDVCAAFDLKSTTLCLAVQLADAYITGSIQSMKIDRCQLAAISCLWIAAKFEEMDDDLPSIKKIVDVCDNSYSKEDVLKTEEAILSFFKWRLPHATVINHFYLQLHMLSSTDLVKCVKRAAGDSSGLITLKLLVMESSERTWKSIEVDGEKKLTELIPQLCALARFTVSKSIELFQIFGENILVTQRTSLDTLVRELSVNNKGETRLFVSNGHPNLVFVERGSFVVLRTINQHFLDIGEWLIQEVVTHVEFLQLHSHVTALGVLGLSMSIIATDLAESKASVQYIQQKFGISVSQSHAAARLLCTKYQEVMATCPQGNPFGDVPADIFDRLEFCLTRKGS